VELVKCQAQEEFYNLISQDLRCRLDTMLTVRCDHNWWSGKATLSLEKFENLIFRLYRNYGRLTGDQLPIIGVISPTKFTRWPHFHGVIQKHIGTDEKPVSDEKALEAIAKKLHLTIKITQHSGNQLDYVARHLLRNGAMVSLGKHVRRNWDRTDESREKSRENKSKSKLK